MVSEWRLMLVLIRILARITLLHNVGSCLLSLPLSFTLLRAADFTKVHSIKMCCFLLCTSSGVFHQLNPPQCSLLLQVQSELKYVVFTVHQSVLLRCTGCILMYLAFPAWALGVLLLYTVLFSKHRRSCSSFLSLCVQLSISIAQQFNRGT